MILLSSLALSCIGFLEPEPGSNPRLDIPIESSFDNYRKLLRSKDARDRQKRNPAADPLDEVVSWGLRIEEWYKELETPSLRTARSPGPAPSIDHPWRYGPKTIIADFENFKTQVDPKTRQILESKGAFPKELPVARNMLDWYRNRLSYISSVAIRWQFFLTSREGLVAAANRDVRGYVFLKREPNLRYDLLLWNGQTEARKKELQFLLINQCRNATSKPLDCAIEFKKEIVEKKNPLRLYELYKNAALENYQNFFRIEKTHPDFSFETETPGTSWFQLLLPEEWEKANWFKNIISRYFNLGDWRLVAEYRNPEMLKQPTRLIFRPGILAHTNGRAGDEIHLDSNVYDLEPYVAAHEFGHILGFDDCYIEFYDIDADENVYYAIDNTDIMCSQAGNVQQKHYDEIRRAYGGK